MSKPSSSASQRTLKSAVSFSPRESVCNWLALGLLLAAWNAADSLDRTDGATSKPRPESLRGYPTVSVRAIHRNGGG